MMQVTSRNTISSLAILGTILLGVSVSNASIFRGENETTSSSAMESIWELDIFNLPPTVPFPGEGWLGRIATTETAFLAPNGETYTSAYAALLENEPLKHPCRNFNAYINSIVLPSTFAGRLVDMMGLDLAHYVLCYLRNFIGSIFVYYGVAFIFHYFCYIHPVSLETFEKRGRPRPSAEIMWDQIKLAQASMAIYVLLPVADEYIVEQGWTQMYFTIAEIGGWTNYLIYFVLYFALVEVGIYWMHRTLHTNKWMYKHIHLLHHKYNKPETLSPWASIAFHPVDGILQASPYLLALPIVPCHYLTHFILLFFTAVWATYIHDAMDLNIDPIMGSKYHTVHHTHYIYNYGQVFTFCDHIWNTYREPDGPTGVVTANKSRTRPTSGRGVKTTKAN